MACIRLFKIKLTKVMKVLLSLFTVHTRGRKKEAWVTAEPGCRYKWVPSPTQPAKSTFMAFLFTGNCYSDLRIASGNTISSTELFQKSRFSWLITKGFVEIRAVSHHLFAIPATQTVFISISRSFIIVMLRKATLDGWNPFCPLWWHLF